MTSPDAFSGSAPAVVGGVRSDVIEVSQSRAVEGVREALAMAGIGGGAPPEDGSRLTRAAGGILSVLSSSPGRSSSLGSGVGALSVNERGERERRVKFAGATEERR
jgi:WD repeat-containing protein 24